MEPKAKRGCYRYELCKQTFTQRQGLHWHRKTAHADQKFSCQNCHHTFTRKGNLQRHVKNHKRKVGGAANSVDDPPCNLQSLGGTVRIHTIQGEGIQKYDPMAFLKQALKDRGALKWYLVMNVNMTRRKGETTDTAKPHFRGKCQTTLKFEDLDEAMRESIKKIFTSFIEYQRQGSNWTVDKVLNINIHMAHYRPLKGSSYIPLLIKLRSKHAIINVKNRDQKCFMWSVLAALHPVKTHTDRVTKYHEYVDELDFSRITFPVKMVDVPKFETQDNLSINVFGYEKGNIFPIHVSKQHLDPHVDLLMTADGKKSHYCWIKYLSRLLGERTYHNGKTFYCPYCLHGFTKEQVLKDHVPYCQKHGPQKVELPKEEDKWLYYKDTKKQLKAPYIIYADFECLQVPISRCEKTPELSSTEKTTNHVPCGFVYKVVGLTPEHCKPPVVYRGTDAADKFVECMVQEQEDIECQFKHCEPMHMTGRDWQTFKKDTSEEQLTMGVT